jgi:chaperonin cofactor prefoldin
METSERTVALEVNVTNMQKQLDSIEHKLDNLTEAIQSKYATKESINRLWTIVWCVVGFVFLGF